MKKTFNEALKETESDVLFLVTLEYANYDWRWGVANPIGHVDGISPAYFVNKEDAEEYYGKIDTTDAITADNDCGMKFLYRVAVDRPTILDDEYDRECEVHFCVTTSDAVKDYILANETALRTDDGIQYLQNDTETPAQLFDRLNKGKEADHGKE